MIAGNGLMVRKLGMVLMESDELYGFPSFYAFPLRNFLLVGLGQTRGSTGHGCSQFFTYVQIILQQSLPSCLVSNLNLSLDS
jgi:hypothetical protein